MPPAKGHDSALFGRGSLSVSPLRSLTSSGNEHLVRRTNSEIIRFSDVLMMPGFSLGARCGTILALDRALSSASEMATRCA